MAKNGRRSATSDTDSNTDAQTPRRKDKKSQMVKKTSFEKGKERRARIAGLDPSYRDLFNMIVDELVAKPEKMVKVRHMLEKKTLELKSAKKHEQQEFTEGTVSRGFPFGSSTGSPCASTGGAISFGLSRTSRWVMPFSSSPFTAFAVAWLR